jgi:hypothetical protein
MRERKHIFIEDNISRNKDSIRTNMKTLVTFVFRTISMEDTLFGTKLKFVLIVWANVRPTSTAKHLEKSVVRRLLKKLLNGSFHVKYTSRQAID